MISSAERLRRIGAPPAFTNTPNVVDLQQMSFDSLGLSPKVLAAVETAGYTTPTPIQQQAIPPVLAGRDVLGIAQTGTGKTASFVLPMLTRLEKGRARARMPRTLILEPTRELAAQVEENFSRYGRNHKLTVALLIGGVSFDDQEKKLDRGADVLIATPGRLLDHFERGKLLLTGVEILVIDEADRMLDMGFIPDIERITKLIPFTRQTLLFSATMPNEIQRLADNFMSRPERVEVSRPASVTKTVKQTWIKTDREPPRKRASLRAAINSAEDLTNAIIFCNRKRDVSIVARSLQRHKFDAEALHGDMDQRARMAVLEKFRKGNLRLLVASDVAARGLDIPAVSHIFNFDVPSHAEDYVHRIGRTGRAGRSGTSVTLAARSDAKYVTAIEKLTGEKVELSDIDNSDEIARSRRAMALEEGGEAAAPAEHRSRRGGHRSRRDSGKPRSAPMAPRDKGSHAPPKTDRDGDRDQPVVGMGDHVPDFMRRPVRIGSS
jgi:superfamily II DNA/RNA helicase